MLTIMTHLITILDATRHTNIAVMWSTVRAIVGCNGATCKFAAFYFSSFTFQLIIRNVVQN